MRNLVLLLIFFVSLPLFARDVYKWTNAEGVVIYSDSYQQGAERLRVPSGDKSPSASGNEEPTQSAGTDGLQAAEYENLEIVQPENEATIRSNEGMVPVSLVLTPGLADGHLVKIIVDGTELDGEMRSTQFSLNQLNRGTHSLETRVVDAEGNVMISSNRVNFHLRQAAIPTP